MLDTTSFLIGLPLGTLVSVGVVLLVTFMMDWQWEKNAAARRDEEKRSYQAHLVEMRGDESWKRLP